MNAIRDFFRKYNAVPANDTGPQWSKATDDALLGWFNANASIVRCGWHREQGRAATHEEREALRPIYYEVAAEIISRAKRPDALPEIVGAAVRAQMPTRS